MFSVTVWVGTSVKCWWTMPRPAAMASRGERKSTGRPNDADLAGVGPVEPVEDVHQRALAGAVLAEQGVDLAGAQVEVDAVVGDDAGEALDDAAHLDGERGRRCGRRRGVRTAVMRRRLRWNDEARDERIVAGLGLDGLLAARAARR